MLYSEFVKPVALRPGRVRLSAKPPPMASAIPANTIGTVRVARNIYSVAPPTTNCFLRA
jgi:hypothetical protein